MSEWKANFASMEVGRGGFKDIDDKSYQPKNFVIDIEIGNWGWKRENIYVNQYNLFPYIKNFVIDIEIGNLGW